MGWSLILTSLVEVAHEEAEGAKRKDERVMKQKGDESNTDRDNGGVLASRLNLTHEGLSRKPTEEEREKAFSHIWKSVSSWVGQVVRDAVDYASTAEPRDSATVSRILRKERPSERSIDAINSRFARSVWPSLKTRGWTASVETEGSSAGQTKYVYAGTVVSWLE